MTKTSGATRHSRTHFEQIAVDVVKKIAAAQALKTFMPEPDNLMVEPARRKVKSSPVLVRRLPKGTMSPDRRLS
jgi:hypothetical protein